jgi:pimeloyl-ACP methyl ester carboxylesterase
MTSADRRSDLLYYTERGFGPPLVLVHGLMISGDMFEPVIDRFAAEHRVIVPDLRGHGRSRRLPPPYDAEELAADVARLLNHLGVERTAMLGYSQGGAIAQQFVLDYPDRCDKLVLACTYAHNMMTLREKLEGRLVPLLVATLGMKWFAKLIISLGLERLEPSRADWVIELIASQDRAAMVSAWRSAMAFDSRQRLADIVCPTLVIAGANDTAVPLSHAKMLHEGIAGSELAIVEGTDHALIWTHPEELVRLAIAFLRC